jgi:serine protease Do
MNNFDRLTIALLFFAIVIVGWSVRSTPPPTAIDQGRRPLPQQTGPVPPSAEPGARRSPLAPPGPNDPSLVVSIPERTGAVSGTAFSVDPGGTWLTARHVVGACDQLMILSPRGWIFARPEYLHPLADLAVLKTNGGPPALGRSTKPLYVGQDGFSFGFPRGAPGAVHGTLMGRSRMQLSDQMRGVASVTTWAENRRLPEELESLGGISGGPLLDEAGDVVGIHVASSRRRGRVMAIAPEFIEELVQAQIIGENRPLGRIAVSADRIEQAAMTLRERFTVTRVYCR